jgi:hypothetical protein
MTTKERKEYILNLDKVVRRWREKSYLFCGGCCFSAGQIASLLEKKGIRYQVVCWQRGNPNEKNLKDIIMYKNCCHLGIMVTLNKKKYLIGGYYCNLSATNIRSFTNIKSETIIEYDSLAAKNGVWNHRYNRSSNSRFKSALTASVSK